MSTPVTRPWVRLRVGDVVITVVLLVVFVLAYVSAQDWPFRAAFFPQLLAGTGVLLAVFKLVGFGIELRRPAAPASEDGKLVRRPAASASQDGKLELVDDEEEKDQSLEYVFGTAGAEAWIAAVAWVAGFFVALWLFGVYITVPVFALAYLRSAGKAGWIAACVYAAVTGGVLWLAFSRLLAVPMPTGMF